MANPNDKNRRSAAFEVNDVQKEQFRQEALRLYAKLDTQEKIEKALQPLVNPSPMSRFWLWTKTHVGSLINMLKVATMSIFLGRAATDKRLSEGNRNAEKQEAITEARKEAKIKVLYEKKNFLEKEKYETGKAQEEQIIEKEQDVTKDQEPKEQTQEQQNEVQLMRSNETILSLQINQMTEQYKNGLSELLQRESGLSADNIHITNVQIQKGKSCIQITMEMAPNVTVQTRIDEHGRYIGNTKKMSSEEKRVCGDIRKLLLYYTAKEYAPSKDKDIYNRTGYQKDGQILRAVEHNRNTLRPGTTLTRHDFMQAFKLANERGHVNYFDFGHTLNVKKENNHLTASIDGQKIDLSIAKDYQTGADMLHTVYTEKIKEDYAVIESGTHALAQSMDIYKNIYAQEQSEIETTEKQEITENPEASQNQNPDLVPTEEEMNGINFEDYGMPEYAEMFQGMPPYEVYDFDESQFITPLDENGCLVQNEIDEQELYKDEQELDHSEQER